MYIVLAICVPRNLVSPKKKTACDSPYITDSESLMDCFFFTRFSYRVSSWIDGSSVQTRPAGDHFTTIPWKNNELSLNCLLPLASNRDGSVCARTRRQTDGEGWETRHPSCQPMCECRAHDLPLSLADATSFAPASRRLI